MIGTGGYAFVYKAVRHSTREIVAIKKFRDAGVTDIQTELTIVEHLGKHPHIISFQDKYEFGKFYHLVMEYLPYSLKQYMSMYPEIPYTDQISMAKQLVCAVQHCHSNSVLHRDITPNNILVSSEGLVKLTDFNLSCFRSKQPLDTFVCYAPYRAPELLSEDPDEIKHYDTEIDIWSLGCVFAELFSPDHCRVVHKEIEQRVGLIILLLTKCHLRRFHEVHELVEMCLQLDPVQRMNIDQLADYMEKCY